VNLLLLPNKLPARLNAPNGLHGQSVHPARKMMPVRIGATAGVVANARMATTSSVLAARPRPF